MTQLEKVKNDLINEIKERQNDKIIEESNAELLIELIKNTDTIEKAIAIAELGTTYKRTGFHFDKRLEKFGTDIHYFKKNNELSFEQDKNMPKNKLIIGDNYDALQNLLITHCNKVDVIYIDPPYSKDSMGQFAQTNYNNSLARDNLLSMLYPRLVLAKQLLTDEGVIFCSIDDKNQAYVKCLFDEVFGEKNFIANIIWQSKYTISNDKKNGMTIQTEYILCFSKNINNFLLNPEKLREDYIKKTYTNDDNDGRGLYSTVQLYKKKNSKSFTVCSPTGKEWTMPWNYTEASFHELEQENKIYWGKDGNACPRKKVYLKDNDGMGNRNLWLGEDVGYQLDGGNLFEEILQDRNLFDYPKPVSLITKILKIATNKNATVLDFFAGSGTTGQAVLELNREDDGNRNFILCTNNEEEDGYIATNVTSKRLKRVMTGKCYDNTTDFDWIKKNKPYGGNLDIFEIKTVNAAEQSKGKTPFDVIDETCYDLQKFLTFEEKLQWVCENFDKTQKYIEGE